MDITTSQETKKSMGRPPLNMQATNIRFPKELLDRIDALVGDKHRAKFIRQAVEHSVRMAELTRPAETKDR